MSIAELVPRWPGLPDPTGSIMRGVSVRGREYKLRTDQNVDLVAAGIMAARGIDIDPTVFLSPRLDRDMPDPMILMDMEKAAERIATAVVRRERVMIFGDYDVDGASASAVMGRWFAGVGLDVGVYIPDRMSEGYGPTPKAIERAVSGGVDLLICVDCGTAAVDVLEAVDADVVVIDHHKQQGKLPDVTALVNPHRDDDTSGLGMLCATALCFLTVTAAQRVLRDAGALPEGAPKVIGLLDIVALATVADVVPLIGPSRLFVSKGLQVIARSPSPGVAALMAVSGVSDVTAGRIGFALGPRVNAGGRVGAGSVSDEGALGVKLLMARDMDEATPIAAQLDAMNVERQEIQKLCLEEATVDGQAQADQGVRIVSVHGEGWHAGIVGIVAGRLRERFDMPVLVGSRADGMIKGSGRSVPGFDLGAVIVEAKNRGLLVTGGGHAMACGFGCRVEEWDAFQNFLRERSNWVAEPVTIDCLIDASGISMEGIESLSMLEPLGQGNPSVKAAISGMRIGGVKQLRNGHLKLDLVHRGGRLEGLWWSARAEGYEDRLMSMEGAWVTVIGSPKVDEWQGRRRISMEIADLVPVDA
jgi:single-stranded-DNA-specific exonuclease